MISEFPLFFFTTCGGLSAGLYIASAIFPKEESKRPWLIPLICFALLGVGLLGVLFHLGRPERFIYGLRNPQAGIAQEGYCAIVLMILYFVHLVLAWRKKPVPRALCIVGAFVALLLTFIMGFAYVNQTGMAAWAMWATVPLFVVGDVAVGLALWALFDSKAYERVPFLATSVVAQVLFLATLVVEAKHFASVGYDAIPFCTAAVVGPVLSVVGAIACRSKNSAGLRIAVFSLAFIGMVIARYTFYAAG